jgi:hypothetical protein
MQRTTGDVVRGPEPTLEDDDRHAVTRPPPGPSPALLAVAFYAVNLTAIAAAIASGIRKGDLAHRFQEKQSITFFSSNQLAMTALLAAVIYLMRRHLLDRPFGSAAFWLLSSLGFFFLMLDESFQFHEGIDSRLFELVGAGAKNPRVDGLSTALYGFGALLVCWTFRAEIVRVRAAFAFFCAGGVFLAATSALNFGDAPPWRVVAEEATKLLGVCSFLLGHVAAFLGTLSEAPVRPARSRTVLPAPTSEERAPSQA